MSSGADDEKFGDEQSASEAPRLEVDAANGARRIDIEARRKKNVAGIGLAVSRAISRRFNFSLPRYVPDLTGYVARLAETVSPTVAALQRQVGDLSRVLAPHVETFVKFQLGDISRQIGKATKGLLASIKKSLPENWHGNLDLLDVDDLERILVEEGIPLAWVPDTATTRKLVEAESPSVRRQIIGARWRGIVSHCEKEIDKVTSAAFATEVEFARKVVSALRAGHTEAAQALAGSVLDTMVRAHWGIPGSIGVSGRKRATLKLDAQRLSEVLVIGGVAGAYVDWFPGRNEPIPKGFSRHAAAHGVSKTQYNRINAVTGLMQVVALLRHIDKFGSDVSIALLPPVPTDAGS